MQGKKMGQDGGAERRGKKQRAQHCESAKGNSP